MTATRLTDSNSARDSTWSGRLVSTTMRRLRLSAAKRASSPERKRLSYSGCSWSAKSRDLAALFSRSSTIRTGLPRLRQMQTKPMAAPKASRSAMRCPMRKTWLDWEMSSVRDEAMTRALTLVRRSVSLVRPPKKLKLYLSLMTAWSPPRLSAISMERLAKL